MLHLVETDAYDRAAREAALRGRPLEELVAKGERLLPHFRELVEDLFSVCFKLVIRLRDPDRGALAWNRRVIDAALAADEIEALRSSCALDAPRAAQAALAIGAAVLEEVRRGELFTEEELASALELECSQRRIDELGRALEGLRPRGEKREGFEEALDRARRRQDELVRALEEALGELPRSLDARVGEALRGAADRVEADESLARSFAEAVGAEVPAGAAARLALSERLRDDEALRRLARVAGAFRADALAARRRRIRRAPSELHRVVRGADLARVLPGELAAYASPVARLDFLRRFAERDLAAYELKGADRGGRGPLVICVDGSGSMRGPRELWAKGVALALLEIARRQNRKVAALIFAGAEDPLVRFDLLAPRGRSRGGRRVVDLAGVLAFAAHPAAGGTSFEAPLREALRLLSESRLRGGDVVFVTDGAARLDAAFVAEIHRAKRRLGFSIHGVLVDDPSGSGEAAAPSRGPRGAERGERELRRIADELIAVSRLTFGEVRGLFERI
ncbi:MAG TPA: VWA domain-containing protein [Vulgatibacter sp.]|nr:VWA domain-containing protein [Vulgatibacter sp.]